MLRMAQLHEGVEMGQQQRELVKPTKRLGKNKKGEVVEVAQREPKFFGRGLADRSKYLPGCGKR